jgi:hypothetical protein
MEDLQHFRSTLRRDVDHWEGRLSTVLQQNALVLPRSSTCSSPHGEEGNHHSTRHIRVRKDLAELQESLDSLRIHYLSTKLLQVQVVDGDSIHDRHVGKSVSNDLPMGDLQVLHSEFAQCVSQLEQAKSSLVPKTKFVFQRYRKACQDQQQRIESLGEGSLAEEAQEPTENNSMTAASNRQLDNPLANKSHASILVSKAGEVVISDKAGLDCGANSINAEGSFAVGGSSHIHNVHHSRIQL